MAFHHRPAPEGASRAPFKRVEATFVGLQTSERKGGERADATERDAFQAVARGHVVISTETARSTLVRKRTVMS